MVILSRLGEIMRDRGLKTKPLALRAGLHHSVVRRLRFTSVETISLPAVEALCRALRIRFTDLFYESPGKRKAAAAEPPEPITPPCGHVVREPNHCYDCGWNDPAQAGGDGPTAHHVGSDDYDAAGD